MKTLNVFIISWAGQHQSASEIALCFLRRNIDATIVFSDPNPNLQFTGGLRTIRRPDNLMWADKLSVCLNACRADLMLVIHADCHSDDYVRLVDQCVAAFSTYDHLSVWSANVDGTYWNLSRTQIANIANSNLTTVSTIDFLVFALDRLAITRLKAADLTGNAIGWGMDLLACSWAHKQNRLVCVDRSTNVKHRIGSGYNVEEARGMSDTFIKQNFDTIESNFLAWIQALAKARQRLIWLKGNSKH